MGWITSCIKNENNSIFSGTFVIFSSIHLTLVGGGVMHLWVLIKLLLIVGNTVVLWHVMEQKIHKAMYSYACERISGSTSDYWTVVPIIFPRPVTPTGGWQVLLSKLLVKRWRVQFMVVLVSLAIQSFFCFLQNSHKYGVGSIRKTPHSPRSIE